MKTAEDRANDFLVEYVDEWTNRQERALINMLKEQDKQTRHICADTMADRFPIDDPEDYAFSVNAIINAKSC